jgi:hypothetical protein
MTTSIVTQPATRLADADWSRFCAEAGALANEIRALYPHLSIRESGDCAAAKVDDLLSFAEQWDAMAEAAMVEASDWQDLLARAEAGSLGSDLVSSEPEPLAPAPIAITPRNHNKATYQLSRGVRIVRLGNGDTLVPSGSQVGIVYRVSPAGHCDCKAGAKGQSCWHVAAARQLEAEPTQIAA